MAKIDSCIRRLPSRNQDASSQSHGRMGEWFGSMGKRAINGGNPVGKYETVESLGSVTKDGGANPVSGTA